MKNDVSFLSSSLDFYTKVNSVLNRRDACLLTPEMASSLTLLLKKFLSLLIQAIGAQFLGLGWQPKWHQVKGVK